MKITSLLLAVAALANSGIQAKQSDVPWKHLSISAPVNGRHLHRTITGEPFFWQADTAWELFHRLNRSDIDFYLRDRASKGFNVIQSVVIPELNGTTFPNFYGQLPIFDADPTRPNEAYFEHVDWAAKRAAEYGILIALVPTWGMYVNCGWHNGPVIFNKTTAEMWGEYIGRRYPGLPKIIGADSNAFWSCNTSAAMNAFFANPTLDPNTLLSPIEDTRDIWSNMVRGFNKSEAAAGFQAFYTWHPTGAWRSTPDTGLAYGHNYMNGSFGRLSMDGVQSGHTIPDPNTIQFTPLTSWDSTKNYENTAAMRAAFSGPVVDLENHYEGAFVGFNTSRPLWNDSVVRHGLWSAVLSGSAGFTYGANAIWQFYAPLDQLARPDLFIEPQIAQPANQSWRDALKFPGSQQAGYVQKLFSKLDKTTFNAMEPDRSFIVEKDVLAFEANRYVAASISTDRYWVYTGFGDTFSLNLDSLGSHLKAPSAKAQAQWYDPRSGRSRNVTEGAIFALKGSKTFVPPTSGSVDHDWVLELQVEK
ncbi:unnamed protein product [Mycena citricolor]|uniref:DUF4038 domain-containing protein n=1 Tax=Mycena citricolor TaxID=2018698 RepID=A0AAD2H206_9AGAR|nr:unnamed protein product [Mycena citricolor]